MEARLSRTRTALILAATAIAAFAFLAPGAAAQPDKDHKATVCHVQGNDTVRAIEIARSAVPAHLDHGDSLPGGPVPGMVGYWYDEDCAAFNNPPVVEDQTFTVDENAPNGTVVGTIVATDPETPLGDVVTIAVTGGSGDTAFAVDAAGVITVADSSQLDYETTPSFTLDVEASDLAGFTDTAVVTINLNDIFEGFVVTTTNDTPDANLGDGICADITGECSIRAAVDQARFLAGPDKIQVPAGTYILVRGPLYFYDEVEIIGAGADQTIINSTFTAYHQLYIQPSASLTMDSLTLNGGVNFRVRAGIFNRGVLVLNDVTISRFNNGTSGPGGAVENQQGTLEMNGSTLITGSSANVGGGIYSVGSAATVTMNDDASITGGGLPFANANFGGGIYNAGSAVVMNDSASITGNRANSTGGGIYNAGGTVAINDTATVTGNAPNDVFPPLP